MQENKDQMSRLSNLKATHLDRANKIQMKGASVDRELEEVERYEKKYNLIHRLLTLLELLVNRVKAEVSIATGNYEKAQKRRESSTNTGGSRSTTRIQAGEMNPPTQDEN